jgi:hypothetical protein|tara:strand:- start:9061 stop:9243 length:183 start_codon:yes stop_codon:yes gene_type:complete
MQIVGGWRCVRKKTLSECIEQWHGQDNSFLVSEKIKLGFYIKHFCALSKKHVRSILSLNK